MDKACHAGAGQLLTPAQACGSGVHPPPTGPVGTPGRRGSLRGGARGRRWGCPWGHGQPAQLLRRHRRRIVRLGGRGRRRQGTEEGWGTSRVPWQDAGGRGSPTEGTCQPSRRGTKGFKAGPWHTAGPTNRPGFLLLGVGFAGDHRLPRPSTLVPVGTSTPRRPATPFPKPGSRFLTPRPQEHGTGHLGRQVLPRSHSWGLRDGEEGDI